MVFLFTVASSRYERKAPGPPIQAATSSTESVLPIPAENTVPQELPAMEHAISSTHLPDLRGQNTSTMVDGACLSTRSKACTTERADGASPPPQTGQEDATWTPAEVVTMSEAESEGEEEAEVGSDRATPEEAPRDRMEFVNDKGITFRTAIPKNDGEFKWHSSLPV